MTRTTLAAALVLVMPVIAILAADRTGPPDSQVREYDAEVPKTIIELQQFRRTTSMPIASKAGIKGTATLINLNPNINIWYVLTVAWENAAAPVSYHLEMAKSRTSTVLLDDKYSAGVVIASPEGRFSCDLFSAGILETAAHSQLIYYPLCGGRLYLRNPAKGNRTALEAATEFIRDQVWGGEQIIILVHQLLADRERETSDTKTGSGASGPSAGGHPVDAMVDPHFAHRLVTSLNLGITLDAKTSASNGMEAGAWYPAEDNPGVFVSMIAPNLLPASILQSYPKSVNKMDPQETTALCYLVAFDLDKFEFAYDLGTTHPRVVWSKHMLEKEMIPGLPGPDGIGSIAPLVSTGLIQPDDGRRAIAAFTGGYKREHGAFKFGEFAVKNHGTHYGFLERGVVFSKLQPGLATIYILEDGVPRIKTWTLADNKMLPNLVYARQNGVALIDYDETTRTSAPGRLVNNWGGGNWGGNEDSRLRSIRAGIGMQEQNGKRFLIYAVFSSATPASMVRVFQAYGCYYAMLADMNALEHTYLALYRRKGSQLFVDHILKDMNQLDKSNGGAVIPRFLGYPDNRDFFYVMKRNVK